MRDTGGWAIPLTSHWRLRTPSDRRCDGWERGRGEVWLDGFSEVNILILILVGRVPAHDVLFEAAVLGSHYDKCSCLCQDPICSAAAVVAHQCAGCTAHHQFLGIVSAPNVHSAAEDAQIMDSGPMPSPSFKRHFAAKGSIGRDVADVIGGEYSFTPVLWRQTGVIKHGPNLVTEGSVETFGNTVELGGVWCAGIHGDAASEAECLELVVDVLRAVVRPQDQKFGP